MIKRFLFVCSILISSCGKKAETIKPIVSGITESIYASGTLKSESQYQAFATVNGIIQEVLVSEGDTVKKDQAILLIINDAQRLGKENAALSASYAGLDANKGKLNEAYQMIEQVKSKMKNDSLLYFRQLSLWKQNIGSKSELELRELTYQNAKNATYSAKVKYEDLKRQLILNAEQSQKSFEISSKIASDFTLRSSIDGIVYQLSKKKGELVNPQTPLAVIGSASNFVLEMQVDEYDILKIEKGQKVMVTMDSYKGKVFEALVTRINPIMNDRSKTFVVDAIFVVQPKLLYPNVSFEANIILQTKKNVLLVPRKYVFNDSFVFKKNGDKTAVTTGLKDYKMIEILSGISAEDELKKPTE